MKALEVPCFLVFSLFLVSNFSIFPKRPRTTFSLTGGRFQILASKTRQKNSETQGANSVPRIPSSCARRVYSFLLRQTASPLQTVFWPKKGFCRETRNFLVFRRRKPFCNQIPREKQETKFPFYKPQNSDQIPFPQQIEASRRKTVERRRTTIRQLKHNKKNNTQKTLEAEESIAKAEEEQDKQEEEEEGHQEENEEK